MSDEVVDPIGAVARAIADGSLVDWSAVERQAVPTLDAALFRELRHLEAIAARCTEYFSTPQSGGQFNAPSHGEPVIGTWAHFDLLAIVGRGAHGVVYRAWDRNLDREVALKLLTTDGDARAAVEGLNLARVSHRNVVTVFGALVHDGIVGLWMEFVRGQSLEETVIRKGPVSAEDAIAIGLDLCDALSAIHAAGLIHRDVKPQNAMREQSGRIVLMDLGASHDRARVDPSTGGTGTPAYMAPELFDGAPASVASDVYALGVLLFRLTTGAYPVVASSVREMASAHASRARHSPRDLRPDMHAGLARVVERALAFSSAERYQSAAELREALQQLGADRHDVLATSSLTAFSTPQPRRHLAMLLLVLAVGSLVGPLVMRSTSWTAAGEVGQRDARSAVSAARIAVLPFENLGSPDQGYFVEGVTDEIRGKLTAVPGLEVIARDSSLRYRGSSRPLEQIASELGVRYLLTGTVRWERAGAVTTSRVRVSPELVEISNGERPAIRWQQPYDRALSDVFQVQEDIALQVTMSLGATLGERGPTAAGPTPNFAAYDEYLKGEAAVQQFAVTDAETLRRAIGHYETAVARDANFAPAWAQLARARANLYAYVTSEPRLAEAAREAAERARTLEPRVGRSALALGDYYSLVLLDNARATEVFEAGLQLAQGDVALLSSLARTEMRLGRWESGLARLTRTLALDPQSMFTWRRYALSLLLLRRYEEARQAIATAQTLSSANIDLMQLKIMLALAEGDVSEARRLAQHPAPPVDALALGTYIASVRHLYWLLDEQRQTQILRLPAAAFGNERAIWALVRMQIHHMRGETRQTREAASQAREELSTQLALAPDDGRRLVYLGLALAHLGMTKDALAAGRRALALVPTSRDAFIGPDIEHQFVRICLFTGERTEALDHLETLVAIPHDLSPARLRIDPTFELLRGNPRFERLVSEGRNAP